MRFVANALVVLGTLGGLYSIWLFRKDRSEVGSKWLGGSILVLGLGTLLVQAT
jgi:hypothetical protein